MGLAEGGWGVRRDFEVEGELKMKRRWDDPQTAQYYIQDRFAHPMWQSMHRREAEVVNELFSQMRPKRVLDLATGPARMAMEMKHFGQGWAADFSQEMVKETKKRLAGTGMKWQAVKEDAFRLSFADGYFDAVTTFRFLRHFASEDRVKLYAQIRRVLKPGGYLVFEALNRNMDRRLFVPEFTGAADRSIYDQLYRKEEAERELEENGFEPVRLVPNVQLGEVYLLITERLGLSGKWWENIWKVGERIDLGRCFQWEVVARTQKIRERKSR